MAEGLQIVNELHRQILDRFPKDTVDSSAIFIVLCRTFILLTEEENGYIAGKVVAYLDSKHD